MRQIQSARMDAPGGRSRQARLHASLRGVWATVLAAVGLVLIPLHVVQAQGNSANLVRSLQTRIATLSRTVQRQQRQMSLTAQRLQRLQAAVGTAAAAGDPTAQAVRSTNWQTMLDKLTARFTANAGTARKSGPAVTTEPALGPDLSGAGLAGAMLRGARLARANLNGANLQNADLTNATLTGSSLRSAKLQGAILTGTTLTYADLTTALYDSRTRWPEGFEPQKRGALMVK